MASQTVNNLRVRSVAINNIVKDGRYDTEDITKAEIAYIKKHTLKPRQRRSDLSRGNLVVVLEGGCAARRAVFLGQADNNMALLFCFVSAGGPAIFKIDERYLLKLSTTVALPSNLPIDAVSVFESKLGEPEWVETESNDGENKACSSILSAISKVKFLKAYLSEDFEVDHSVEFYSQEY